MDFKRMRILQRILQWKLGSSFSLLHVPMSAFCLLISVSLLSMSQTTKLSLFSFKDFLAYTSLRFSFNYF